MDSKGAGLPEQQDTSPSGVDIPCCVCLKALNVGILFLQQGALAAETGCAQDLSLQQKHN